ncbi:MAG TPA: type II toxin-antitoxin system VapC family toxin [Chloroflexota bacterium]|jgi:tRNA(fMet)-specific endonuclease VapC|nr:type II toxin-antitoxin system VapC family toxin [Chloroflexota bacterium]
MRLMLDSNACISVMRRRSPEILTRLKSLAPGDVAISGIVRFELEYGVCHSRHPEQNRAQLGHFLRYIETLDWGEKQALEAAEIRCQLARAGQIIGSYDVLIAAHARSLSVPLVTRNIREFGRVPRLLVEDWESP